MRAHWPGRSTSIHRTRKQGRAERVENVSSIQLGRNQPRSGLADVVDHWSRSSVPRSPSSQVSRTVSGRAVVMPHRSAVAVARTRRSALALSTDLRVVCVSQRRTMIADSAATIHEMRYARDMSAYALRSCGGCT
eukprot:2503539-Rhodomonas_salina.6